MASKRQSYYATLRALQDFSRRSDVSYGEAQQVWRLLRDWLGESSVSRDVERHPVKVAQFIDEIRRRFIPPPPPPRPEPEEWEITWKYTEQETGKRHHITIRAVGPKGATREEVRRVFWRALNGGKLDHWKLSGVDWQQESKSGRGGGDFHYRVAELATPEFRNLWNHARPRVEPIED